MFHASLGPADDLLYGAASIAAFLGIPLRKTFYLLEQRRIPAGRLGREYVASRTALRTHFRKLARGDGAENQCMGPTTPSDRLNEPEETFL